jgi:hypothetical protein
MSFSDVTPVAWRSSRHSADRGHLAVSQGNEAAVDPLAVHKSAVLGTLELRETFAIQKEIACQRLCKIVR